MNPSTRKQASVDRPPPGPTRTAESFTCMVCRAEYPSEQGWCPQCGARRGENCILVEQAKPESQAQADREASVGVAIEGSLPLIVAAILAGAGVMVFTQTSSAALSILGGALVVAGIGVFFGC
jgi:predicted ATP-dependent serine protease